MEKREEGILQERKNRGRRLETQGEEGRVRGGRRPNRQMERH